MFLIFLKKAWDWLKKYWKWILFPIGILLLVGGIIAKIIRPDPPPGPDFSKDGDDALDAIEEANRRRDLKLAELEEKNKQRLEQLSSDQQKEYEELKDKDLEEVVAWFDRL